MTRNRLRGLAILLGAVFLLPLGTVAAGPLRAEEADAGAVASAGGISARGRIEPKDGVRKVVGPSQMAIFSNVLLELRVNEGDRVTAGQVIAALDTYPSKKAEVARLRAERLDAEREFRRIERLHTNKVVSQSEYDRAETTRTITQAMLERADADLELALVRAPITGQVLKIYTYPGERVEMQGIAEIGQTDAMYVIAEVYESDISKVRVGARAVATTPSLKGDLLGTVEEVGWKVGKMDVLDTDPAAKTDARVVEVKIRLDDSERVARLTNMQVEVKIAPGAGA